MRSHSITFLQHAQARRMLFVSVSQHVQKNSQSPWDAWITRAIKIRGLLAWLLGPLLRERFVSAWRRFQLPPCNQRENKVTLHGLIPYTSIASQASASGSPGMRDKLHSSFCGRCEHRRASSFISLLSAFNPALGCFFIVHRRFLPSQQVCLTTVGLY